MGPFLVEIYDCKYISMYRSSELESTIKDRQCTYERDIKAPSVNHCRSGKAKSMGNRINIIPLQFNSV